MLVCIIGRSSSGKDSIYKRLLNSKRLHFNAIVTYTTRPMRSGESSGKEYYFVSEKEYQRYLSEGKIIEQRSYETAGGLWRYFIVDDGQIVSDRLGLVILTIQRYLDVASYLGRENTLPIFIECDKGELLTRALRRERGQANPNYAEMCRRFLADSEDFSDDNIDKLEPCFRVLNVNLNHCVEEIEDYVLDNLESSIIG